MLILLFSIVRNEISVSSVKSQITSLLDCSLRVFSKCLCLCHCICLGHCLFVGQVMAAHHSDQMSQRSQVSSTALWGCSLNVFVFLLVRSCLLIRDFWPLRRVLQISCHVIVIVFVIVIVILLFKSCLVIALITCLKGHKSLRVLYCCVFQQCGVSR